MTNKELQSYLAQFPDEMPVKLLVKAEPKAQPIELTEENILHSSESAYVNSDAPEDEWDTEDGKIELGSGFNMAANGKHCCQWRKLKN